MCGKIVLYNVALQPSNILHRYNIYVYIVVAYSYWWAFAIKSHKHNYSMEFIFANDKINGAREWNRKREKKRVKKKKKSSTHKPVTT